MSTSEDKHPTPALRPPDAAGERAGPWASLSTAERNEYIEKYAPLIRYVADRLMARLPSHVSKEDLISSGILGLIDAVDKFDPARNILFKTYAEFRVKGAMLDELRSMDWVPRSVRRKSSQLEKTYQELETALGRPATDEEAAEAMNLTIEEFHHLLDDVKTVSVLNIDAFHSNLTDKSRDDIFDLVIDETQDPLTTLNMNEARNIVAQTVERLPEKEKLVVSMYYYDELTMKEIGLVLGYTESRISQLHTKAVTRLRTRLKRYFEIRTE